MLIFALVLFLIAAVLGLIVLLTILKNHTTPKPVVVIHGIVGGFALLIALTYIALGNVSPLYLTSMGLLLVGIVIGFTVFGIDISGMRIPKWLALLHPAFAAAGIILLLIFVVQHQT